MGDKILLLLLVHEGIFLHHHEEYQEFLNLNPNHEKALFSLGWVLMDEKRLIEAVPLFKKAIQLKPNDANIYFGLGIVYDEMGRSDDALLQYRKALQIDDNHAGAHEKITLAKKNREIKTITNPQAITKVAPKNSDIILIP